LNDLECPIHLKVRLVDGNTVTRAYVRQIDDVSVGVCSTP